MRRTTRAAAADGGGGGGGLSRDELGVAGVAAVARLAALELLALNNHITISDHDLAPLLRPPPPLTPLTQTTTTTLTNASGSSSSSCEGTRNEMWGLKALELNACARVSPEMVAVLLEVLPLAEIQLNR